MVSYNSKGIGNNAEQEACRFLESKGFILLEKNYTCRVGEIDLIMQDLDDIVFVEVRFRKHDRYGLAIETIDGVKQRKLLRTANYFLQQNRWIDKRNCRFDVIAIQGCELEWIKNAFEECHYE